MRTHQLSWSAARRLARHRRRIAPMPISFCISACARRWPTARAIASCARMFAKAHVVGCSTGGQIRNDDVDDDIAAVALRFDAHAARARLRGGAGAASIRAPAAKRSGARLRPTISPAFSFCPTASTSTAASWSPASPAWSARAIPLTGGLAGDGAKFEETLVGADCAPRKRPASRPSASTASAIRIGHGSAGGWDEFGPRRRITRSRGNVLLRTRRRAGARSLRALSRRGRRERPARHRRCCSRC